jgi:hypothetical protein
MDEVKITKSNLFHTSKTEISSRTLSDPTRQWLTLLEVCPSSNISSHKPLTRQCPYFKSWPNGYILERALYIPIQLQWLFSIGFQILLLKEFISSILRAFSHSLLELPFKVHC